LYGQDFKIKLCKLFDH